MLTVRLLVAPDGHHGRVTPHRMSDPLHPQRRKLWHWHQAWAREGLEFFRGDLDVEIDTKATRWLLFLNSY